MTVRKVFLLFLIIGTFMNYLCDAVKRTEILDNNGKYLAEWEVDFETEIIVFTVDVETTGFVGFGISMNPSMAGADIVIGGVRDDKTTYFADYHAPSNGHPQLDESEDWELINATEFNRHTKLQFKRKLNTCDGTGDVAITADTQYLIWAIGDTDSINYHGADPSKRGPKIINLLDASFPAVDLRQYETYQIRREHQLLPVYTSYWCTVHKAPNFDGMKHHIVAFNTSLTSQMSIRHVHHISLFMCQPPAGETTEFFEQFLNQPGVECFEPNPVTPDLYCYSILYVWAVGGEMLVLPEKTGYSIGDSDRQEYFMLQAHIDNPALETGSFEIGIDLFYTKNLRDIDASVFVIMHSINHLQIIPPRTDDFVNIAHCSSECTSARIPEEGMTLFNVMFHAHTAAKRMRTRIIRDGKELPWLAVDNYYNFDYQTIRPFQEYQKILPGDHIITECTYDTTARPNVTLSGFPTTYEMCQVFFWYYPKSLVVCDSSANPDLNDLFGIENYTAPERKDAEPILTKPDEIAGLRLSEYLNTLNWTDDLKNRLQQALRYGAHETRCLGSSRSVTYPEINQEYVEEDVCDNNSANVVQTFSLSAFFILLVTIVNNS